LHAVPSATASCRGRASGTPTRSVRARRTARCRPASKMANAAASRSPGLVHDRLESPRIIEGGSTPRAARPTRRRELAHKVHHGGRAHRPGRASHPRRARVIFQVRHLASNGCPARRRCGQRGDA
jgi:hypothetical protein